jgi:hypothetical protein
MIKCICINDKGKPNDIPQNKWVKKGQEYTIIFTIMVLPQRTLAVQLEEIDLDESCSPYEYFLAERFMFDIDDIQEFIDFIEECTDINMSIRELMEQTNINERAADTV